MFMRNIIISGFIIYLLGFNSAKAQIKILFDATKAETAGSAEWVIDADKNNLYWSKTGTVSTTGNNANAQRLPSPDQSLVTASTTDTFWTGALSSWAIDCVKKGYYVETLPYNGKITYGDKTNVQDLSNYKIYVICEPNILFSAVEKTAILNFVKNGGSLFIISDHAGSDRNNDGNDSPTIWNDFFTNNGIVKNPFGISFYATNPNIKVYPSDITEVSTKLIKTTNPITNGTFGTVKKFSYSGGTTMLLDTTANNTVRGVIFANESTSTLDGAMVVYARYGKGKIVATGDSSPVDDGTGSSASTLYKSYSGDSRVGDNHRYMFMNSIIWLGITDTVLPIKFINISSKSSNSTMTICWQTISSNQQQSSFQVERSFNGIDFTYLGSINTPKNTVNGVANYEYAIQEEPTLIVYYRIKSEENGIVTYSKVVKQNANAAVRPINIYPNPFSLNKDNIITISGLSLGSQVVITNLIGEKCFETKASNSTLTLNANKISNQPFTQGLYVVTVRDINGTRTNCKLVVNK